MAINKITHREGNGDIHMTTKSWSDVATTRWLVWEPDADERPEDGHVVVAIDAEDAAEDFAEWSDIDGDYTIISGHVPTLHVRLADDPAAPVEVFVVSGESVPRYSARKVEK